MSHPSPSSDAVTAAAKSHDYGGRAVIGTDISGTVVYWNEAAAVLYGSRADDAIGRKVVDVTPTETSVEESANIMNHMRAGRDWTGDFMVRRRDGTPVVMHVTTIPVLEQGEVIGVVGVSFLDSRRTPGSMRAMKE